ncbi:hypothetical protein ACOMHN_050020 [Nucella lapillus]
MSAVNGVNGVSKAGESSWNVGLVNFKGTKYLTAETFGHKVNVSAGALKKKQIFTLEQDPVHEVVYIKSHLGCYLSADRLGNVSCDAEERGETEKFIVEYDKGFTGLWAFKHVVHSNYLGIDKDKPDQAKCFSKSFTEAELWTVRLSIHPQVHLRNQNRKRYAHVCDDQLQVTQTIPWAAKSLVFLDFKEGRYFLKSFDNRFLLTTGELSDTPTDDAKFTLEIRSGPNGGMAFRDRNGYYLMGVGSTATMKGRNKTVGKDELFTLEDTHPQVVLHAYNGKKASIKQGMDVSANQGGEETDNEIFQMEYHQASGKWAFRSVDNKYWVFKENVGGIQASDLSISSNALFGVEWQEDGRMALKASNGLYVYNKPTGSMLAGGESVTDKGMFRVQIVNRPMLVLKCDHGFVGMTAKNDVVCNRAEYDIVHMENCTTEAGVYFFKTNGKYWSVSDDGSVVADSSNSATFQLQVRDNRKLTITTKVGDKNLFLKGEQNGVFKAVGEQMDSSVLWEY